MKTKTGNPLDALTATILIVDDVEDNLDILRDLLTFNGYTVHTVQSGSAALKRVQETRPDLILMDILMPEMDGFEVCACLKADESTRDIPVIFVSSMTDTDSKVTGFKVGGVDYINKPFQHAEILARLNTHLSLLRLREHLQLQNVELQRLANTDYLTDLYNRRCFFQAAEERLAGANLCGAPISVTLIDLDHFKRVNDIYGHLVGDRVLVHVAQLIRAHCREYDLAARYGGEEFVLLHPASDSQLAFQIAENIRKEVENTPFLHESEEIGMTLSAGVVDTKGYKDFRCIDDVLAMADIALYQAKDAGRNQVIVFDQKSSTRSFLSAEHEEIKQ